MLKRATFKYIIDYLLIVHPVIPEFSVYNLKKSINPFSLPVVLHSVFFSESFEVPNAPNIKNDPCVCVCVCE